MTFTRYAIYYTPPPGAFSDAGAAWLGWDIAQGKPVEGSDEILVNRPRKYGFHATIKAPFRLAPDQDFHNLTGHFENLCARLPANATIFLTLAQVGPFLALVPAEKCPILSDIAARAVQDLDMFRAPPTADDPTKHNALHLTERQAHNVKTWGYPHVLEDFKFHMTLTGRLKPTQKETALTAARNLFSPFIATPLTIQTLSLVGERADGMFQTLMQVPLGR